MALPAKKQRDLHETDVLEVVPPSPKSAPIFAHRESDAGPLPQHSEPATEEKVAAIEKIGGLSGEAAGRVELTFHHLSDKARSFSRELQHRARRMKRENPLQALTVIAAAAFMAGLILRIWRSQKNG